MNYKDYVGLKLQNFSKADFENLNQMNFASDTTGYMQRVTKDLEPKKVNKPVNPFKHKPSSENQQTSSSANTQSNQQTSNNQATTSPSKSQDNTNTQTNSNSNQQTKSTATNKPTNTTNTTSNPPTEKKTVKNWYGSNVDFEKRDGKWYRSGTNEEVSKTGKWKSYFDEKSGVKNVRNTSGKSTAPKSKVRKPEKATESTAESKRRFDVLGNAVSVSDKEAEAHNKVNPTKLMTDQERKNLAKKSNTQTTQSNTQDKKYDKNGKPILDISNQHANYSKYDKKYLDMLLEEGRLDKAEYDRIMKLKNQMEPVYRINLAH